MVRNRAVIHLNIADFAARVEACLTPALRDRPMIIAPAEAPRARVFDMNEQAFQQGIRKNMPLARARRLHPDIPVLPPRFRQYRLVMKDILKQAAAFSPCIESGSIDGHLFLDITGTSRLHGPPPDVAWQLRRAVENHLGLDPIWTLATNKLVAKAASRVVKPTGEYIVGAGEEAAFLAPLPLTLLPGLTQEECRTLARFNIVSVAQARMLTRAQLSVPFDSRALRIHDLLQGIDPSPVGIPDTAPGEPRIRADHEFADDTNDAGRLKAGLALMTAQICQNLRRNRQQARLLTIAITYSDSIGTRRTVKTASDNEMELLKTAWDLFLAAATRRVRVRHLSLGCTPAPRVPVQAALFTAPGPRDAARETASARHLLRAMDSIRTRFGALAVQSGAALSLGPLGESAGCRACP